MIGLQTGHGGDAGGHPRLEARPPRNRPRQASSSLSGRSNTEMPGALSIAVVVIQASLDGRFLDLDPADDPEYAEAMRASAILPDPSPVAKPKKVKPASRKRPRKG